MKLKTILRKDDYQGRRHCRMESTHTGAARVSTETRIADYGPDDICAEWLIRLWPTLSERTRIVIQRDLEEDFRRDDKARAEGDNYKPLGMDMDRAGWEKVRALWNGKEQPE